jgi:hypothetical protein
VVLEYIDNTSRTPDSSVLGVLDDLLTTTNHPNFVNYNQRYRELGEV